MSSQGSTADAGGSIKLMSENERWLLVAAFKHLKGKFEVRSSFFYLHIRFASSLESFLLTSLNPAILSASETLINCRDPVYGASERNRGCHDCEHGYELCLIYTRTACLEFPHICGFFLSYLKFSRHYHLSEAFKPLALCKLLKHSSNSRDGQFSHFSGESEVLIILR